MAFSWIIFLSLLVVLGRGMSGLPNDPVCSTPPKPLTLPLAVAPAVPYAITSYLTNHPSPASCSFYCTSLQTISSVSLCTRCSGSENLEPGLSDLWGKFKLPLLTFNCLCGVYLCVLPISREGGPMGRLGVCARWLASQIGERFGI